jgi:hypothetical protein
MTAALWFNIRRASTRGSSDEEVRYVAVRRDHGRIAAT